MMTTGRAFGAIDHLFGRFPWLAQQADVGRFLVTFGASAWGEDRTDANEVVVSIVSEDGRAVLQAMPARAGGAPTIVVEHPPVPAAEALATIRRTVWSRGEALEGPIQAVASRTAGLKDFAWVATGAVTGGRAPRVVRFELAAGARAALAESTRFPYVPVRRLDGKERAAAAAARSDPDWPGDCLATNDLHHPGDDWVSQEAQNVAAGAGSAWEMAERIKTYFADGGGAGMTYYHSGPYADQFDEFIWSDQRINNAGRQGVCDEFAVMQMSFLRALNIKCRILYLWWQGASKGLRSWPWGNTEVGHAVIEYLDGSRWVHLDGLWGLHDQPGYYKQTQNTPYVDVQWLGQPDDTVSTGDTNHYKDPTGDGFLNVLKDWQVVTVRTGQSPYNP